MKPIVLAEDGQLVERDEELRRLSSYVAQARDGALASVLIEGPAGIGKTGLIDAALRHACEQEMLVAHTCCFPVDQQTSLGMMRAVAQEVIAAAGDELELGVATRPVASLVADSANELSSRESILDALGWLLTDATAIAPLVVAIDDLHWADDTSIEWLVHLLRATSELPLAVLLAARTDELDAAGSQIGALRDCCVRVEPQPLTRGGVAAIVRGVYDAADPTLCAVAHAATGGNPFLLGELLGELGEEGHMDGPELAARAVRLSSLGVNSWVLSRLERMPGEARRLARALSVLGPGASASILSSAAAVPRATTASVVEILVDHGILAPGPSLSFVHPVVRSSIYGGIPADERADLHRRVARLLDAGGWPAAHVAAHLVQCEPLGEEWVVDVLESAGHDAIAHGSNSAAARYLRRALSEPPPPARRPELLLALGIAQARTADVEAEALLSEAFALAREDSLRMRAAMALGQLLTDTGHGADAVAGMDQGVAALGSESRELALRLEADALVVAQICGMPDVSHRRERLTGEARFAATLGERCVLGTLAWSHTLAASATADDVTEMARAALGEDGALLQHEGVDSIVLSAATLALIFADAHDHAGTHIAARIALAQSQRSVRGYAAAMSLRALTAFFSGSLTDAEADALHALELFREHNMIMLAPISLLVSVECFIERRRVEDAIRLSEDYSRWIDPASKGAADSTLDAVSMVTRARLMLVSGDADGALAQLLRCRDRLAAAGIVAPALGHWRSAAAAIMTAQGRFDEGRALIEEEVRWARAFGAPRDLGVTLGAACVLADPAESLALAREAVEAIERGGGVLELARAQRRLGITLLRMGRTQEAREPLRHALENAHRAGSIVLAESARRGLVEAGGRPRRTPPTGMEALTATEERTAALAASGLSNREIAERSFFALRTVERHLTAVYRKLGISSREELQERLGARALRRAG